MHSQDHIKFERDKCVKWHCRILPLLRVRKQW